MRTSNLIGPEKILKQSIALDSNSSSKMERAQHYHTLNRFNSQSEQNQQINSLSETGKNTPWTQSKGNLAGPKHQSIWNNNSLNQFAAGTPGGQFVDPEPSSNARSTKFSPNELNPNLKLQIGHKQFSSVLEDVEMEQQTSPLRRKNQQHEFDKLNTSNNSQQSLLASYGGAGFQITKTAVIDPLYKRNALASNEPSVEPQQQTEELRKEASKQELISEIKYHYSQEKALAASKG